jgi:energy-coupling factor transport system ATP-binding protein
MGYMIELKNVSFKYGSGKKDYNLIDLSLRVKKGECLILTGESGCGKTTLTRILNGLCPNYYEGTLKGSYILNGEVVFVFKDEEIVDQEEAYEKTMDEIGTVIGNVFQDPRSQFFAVNTTDEIVLAMENRNFSRERMRERLKELDELMEGNLLLNRNLFRLSSGEKQKVAIMAACAVEPKVVILDEPSANLDEKGTLQLRKLLAKLKDKGYTIIVSEHRLSYLKNIVDRMIVMRHGKIDREYERSELLKLTDEEMIQMGLRILNEVPLFQPTGKRLGDTPLLKVDKLCFRRGDKTIFRNMQAEFYRGQITAITGQNGVGKTTFCKLIAGELRQQKGSVHVFGGNIPAKKRIHDCFFVGQDADYQIFTATVLQEITLNTDYQEEDAVVRELLERFDLWEFRKRHPASLSGGQKQRVLLAAGILSERPILVLDEPTSGLDGKHMRIIAQSLKQIAELGSCILVITHDKEFINIVADAILKL